MKTREELMNSLNAYIECSLLPYDSVREDVKNIVVSWAEDTINGDWTTLADKAAEGEKLKYDEAVFNQQQAEKLYNLIKEHKPMNDFEKIKITFKSDEPITYGKDEWDDYAYDGKAVIVKKNSTWIGIYNFDDVFCVELKEK